MINYYERSPTNRYHVSVGAVLVNAQGQVACHYFKNFQHAKGRVIKDLYILMRESMHVGERPEDTLRRGLMEEFGATAEVVAYLGSTVGMIEADDYTWQKTTLYFLCRLKHWDIGKRDPNDEEKNSQVQWHGLDKLAQLMQQNQLQINGETLNEAEILKRVQAYIEQP